LPPRAVASAIQRVVATRLGRGFLPAGVLFVVGVAELVAASLARGLGGPVPADALLLSAGALATAGATWRPRPSASYLPLLGTWVLCSWMRVVEGEQLARHMTFGLEARGGEA